VQTNAFPFVFTVLLFFAIAGMYFKVDHKHFSMKKYLFVVISLLALTTYGQTKPPVKILSAFMEIKYPGNIPVDDNGRPLKAGPDTSYTILAEAGKEKSTWGYAYHNGNVYTVIASRVARLPYQVKAKETGRKKTFSPAKGNSLWLLELVPYDGYKKTPVMKEGSFLIQLKYGKNSFRLVTEKIIEREGLPSV
jgi:hypothetical protein